MPQGSFRGTAPPAYCASGGNAPWDCCLGCVYLPGCPTQPCGQVGCVWLQCSDTPSLQCIEGTKHSLTHSVFLSLWPSMHASGWQLCLFRIGAFHWLCVLSAVTPCVTCMCASSVGTCSEALCAVMTLCCCACLAALQVVSLRKIDETAGQWWLQDCGCVGRGAHV